MGDRSIMDDGFAGGLDDVRTRQIATEARGHLVQEILPFWFPDGVDREHGGYFTCFDNRGRFVSDRKYTWSQGRFVSVCADLAACAQTLDLPVEPDRMLDDARQGAEFLHEHAVRDDGTTHYLLERDGTPLGEERSFYADCFAAIGFAALARASRAEEWLTPARAIADAAWTTSRQDLIPTAPYQMPEGTSVYGVHMILLNLELDIARAREELGLAKQPARLSKAVRSVNSMARSDGLYDEVRSKRLDEDSLLRRHRTPGHSLEGLWMLAAAGPEHGAPGIDNLVERCLKICDAGYDERDGGLFRYVDRDGGEPRGTHVGLAYEDLVHRTWDSKLWWVHTEAAYTLSLLAQRSGDARVAQWRDRIWAYTRETFPAGGEGEEWIQIRDRAGAPLDEVVALPLKDPYHATRNLIQLLRLAKTD